jgi:hypothetical protein
MSNKADEIKSYVCAKFAEIIGLPASEFIDANLSLAAIVTRSDKLTNSVDLMEAFAKTANAVKKQFGFRVRLSAFPLDTPISTVIEAFVAEVQKAA